jgi:hypothetical protein
MMRDYLIAAGAIVALMLVWGVVLHAAKKRPNNGNEFSRDDHPNIFT